MTAFPKFASVVLDLNLDKPLDYGIPPDLIPLVKKGQRVEVTVKGHPRQGYIFDLKHTPSYPRVVPIVRILSDSEILTEDLFELALWMSKYYYAPLSQVIKAILPSSLRKETKPRQQLFVMRAKSKDALKEICTALRARSPGQAAVLDVMLKVKKGILLTQLLEETKGTRSPVDSLVKKGYLSMDIVRVERSPLENEQYFRGKPKTLNEEQSAAFAKISSSLERNAFETHLIHGVTGSGKTEIYLQSIAKALEQGKGSIVLVPEISLTSQIIDRLKSRFENQIAVLHHRLSDGERSEAWKHLKTGKLLIAVGARSAIFSPVKNLGLIIVDEEHEHAYKQSEDSPCYHARDVAVMRGKLSQATVLLGSATPSLESYHNALTGKYILSPLRLRAETSVQAHVLIVDMKKEYEKSKGFTNFSAPLLEGIEKRHRLGEQTILFLNRRGYHTTLFCQQCRKAIECPHCDRALTYHQEFHALTCHLCGYSLAPPPRSCPCCQASDLMKYRGVGTELLEKSLHAIFPSIRTLRIDADTTRHKGSHQKLLREFGTGKADILIGTQMIAKGLHFPEVTLVGVINCDSSLHIPDFRSSETTFQLITQVAGRAGRGALPGEVILQTCMPDNTTIQHAANQDYLGFYHQEIASRELFQFPPFSNLIKILFTGADEKETLGAAHKQREGLLKKLPPEYTLHPVLPSGHAKIKGKFRFQLLIQGPKISFILHALKSLEDSLKIPRGIKTLVDVNPSSTYF